MDHYHAWCNLKEGVKDLKIAVVREGFGHEISEADVDAKVKAAAARLKKAGAKVKEVSIPMHLDGLAIRIDREPDSETMLTLARAHRLTAYDASYLELALRLGAPLATLDRALAAAARTTGAPLLGEDGV